MYILRFIKTDNQSIEEYSYQFYKDATYHLELFTEDSSSSYFLTDIIDTENGRCLRQLLLIPLGKWARLRLEHLTNHEINTYNKLIYEGSLLKHLVSINNSAQKTFDFVLEFLASSCNSFSRNELVLLAEDYSMNMHIYN